MASAFRPARVTGSDAGLITEHGFHKLPFLLLAPVVLAAVHDATDLWLDELPIRPERMWQALHKKREV